MDAGHELDERGPGSSRGWVGAGGGGQRQASPARLTDPPSRPRLGSGSGLRTRTPEQPSLAGTRSDGICGAPMVPVLARSSSFHFRQNSGHSAACGCHSSPPGCDTQADAPAAAVMGLFVSHFAKLGTVAPNPGAPPWTASPPTPLSPGGRGPGSLAAFPRTPLTAVLERLVGTRLEAGGPVCQLGPSREHGRRQGALHAKHRTPNISGEEEPRRSRPHPEPWEDTRGHTGYAEPGNPQASEEGALCSLKGERLVPEAPKAACDESGRCWSDIEGQESTGPLPPAPPHPTPPSGAGRAGGRERGLLHASPAKQREGRRLWSRKK